MDFKNSNWLDRFLGFLAPGVGAKRIAQRNAMHLLSERAYDAASNSRRTKGWRSTNADAETEVNGSLVNLRNRSRDLVRNNPFAKKGLSVMVSNSIGTGIMLKLGDEKLQAKFKLWSENPENCDFTGTQNFYGLQALMFSTIAESGEVLIRKHRSAEKGKRIQLELLEPDFLDTTKIDEHGRIRGGIQFDEMNRVEGYWLYQQHPGAMWVTENFYSLKTNLKSSFYPKSEIKHIFLKTRAGQVRGVPWFAPSMMRLRDYDDYEDAQLMRQKIAACFVGFLFDTADPMNQSATTSAEKKPLSQKFEPGAWEVLPPGKDIKFGTPPGVGADYGPYARQTLLAIAAGLGISYESLTGDLSNVNFSSGRMGWIEMQRMIEQWRWLMFIPNIETCLFWWLEGESVGTTNDYSNVDRTWTPPRREMIDPVKETEAMKEQVRNGFTTLSDTVRQQGNDPVEHFAEMEKDNKMLDEKKLVLDSDPRVDLKSNLAKSKSGSGGNSEDQQPS